ncbi:C-X-C chemokine receptor type 5 [Anguilla rostrata]|uniref:C-X-C chemokine receptor type 5 n=1 Tax=Anguilla rostrata TaxID=7938 RepID=UPI0030D04C28
MTNITFPIINRRSMDQITKRITIEGLDEFDYPNYSCPSSNCSEGEDWELACDGAVEMQAFHAWFQPLAYGVMLLLGVTGNGLLLAVLLRRRTRLRATEVYLLHLAVADLLLLLTFPFSVAEHAVGWLFGDFLCAALGFLRSLNFFCGVLLLACISFERYLAVVHAVRSLRGRRPLTGHLTCAAVWLVSAGVSAPICALLSVEEGPADQPRCRLHRNGIHDSNWVLASRALTLSLGFFLPLAVMTYCYAAVILALCRSRHRSLEKHGAVRLALLVTAAFCLCWLPYNVAALLDTLVMLRLVAVESCDALTRSNRALAVTEGVGYAHCCLIPLLYAFLGVHFRRELRQLPCAAACCLRWGGWPSLPSSRLHSTTQPSWSEGAVTTATKVM